MAQITIYLPDRIEARARKAAKADGKSVSRWIADQLIQHLEQSWAPGVLDAAGAIPDCPSLEEIRRGYGPDVLRESVKFSRHQHPDLLPEGP
jgi:hypothetical protein